MTISLKFFPSRSRPSSSNSSSGFGSGCELDKNGQRSQSDSLLAGIRAFDMVHWQFYLSVAQWPELRGESTHTSGDEGDIDEDDGEEYEDTESKHMQSNGMYLHSRWLKGSTGGSDPQMSCDHMKPLLNLKCEGISDTEPCSEKEDEKRTYESIGNSDTEPGSQADEVENQEKGEHSNIKREESEQEEYDAWARDIWSEPECAEILDHYARSDGVTTNYYWIQYGPEKGETSVPK